MNSRWSLLLEAANTWWGHWRSTAERAPSVSSIEHAHPVPDARALTGGQHRLLGRGEVPDARRPA